jgi:hypothetical protein
MIAILHLTRFFEGEWRPGHSVCGLSATGVFGCLCVFCVFVSLCLINTQQAVFFRTATSVAGTTWNPSQQVTPNNFVAGATSGTALKRHPSL